MMLTPTPTILLVAALTSGGSPHLPASMHCDLYPSPLMAPTTNEVRQVTIGDIDGDGHLDLAVAANTSPSVEILRNLGGRPVRSASSSAEAT